VLMEVMIVIELRIGFDERLEARISSCLFEFF
jgi:hypothetical protein